ncbi:hypothetical protein Avbf_10364 [Armadillidium vulgare]|nr:hypothetical protein Avbf_10364 [Armadillidium vulgare]
MAGRGLLNLTLDEIIKQQNLDKRFQSPLNRTGGRRNFSRNLSTSLSNRLSRGVGRGGFAANPDIRRNQNFSRLSLQGKPNKPIYSRLTRNKPPLRSNNAVQRGISTKSLKTRNAEEFHPVRINNGAIVKGLRSDQLLLQKISQAKSKHLQDKIEKVRALQAKRANSGEEGEKQLEEDPTYDPDDILCYLLNHPSSSSSSSSSSEEDYSPPPSTSRRVSSSEAAPKDPLYSVLRIGAERPTAS